MKTAYTILRDIPVVTRGHFSVSHLSQRPPTFTVQQRVKDLRPNAFYGLVIKVLPQTLIINRVAAFHIYSNVCRRREVVGMVLRRARGKDESADRLNEKGLSFLKCKILQVLSYLASNRGIMSVCAV